MLKNFLSKKYGEKICFTHSRPIKASHLLLCPNKYFPVLHQHFVDASSALRTIEQTCAHRVPIPLLSTYSAKLSSTLSHNNENILKNDYALKKNMYFRRFNWLVGTSHLTDQIHQYFVSWKHMSWKHLNWSWRI